MVRHSSQARHKPARPLDAAALEALALAYAARFATSAGRLAEYLTRKLRQRGAAEGLDAAEAGALVEALVEKMVVAGYVDDAGFARARAGGMLRRGLGARRIGEALAAAGIAGDLRAEVMPDDAEARQAALALARRRGFGPFGPALPDAPKRQKQIAAMLRAGHGMDAAVALVRASNPAEAEDWANAPDL